MSLRKKDMELFLSVPVLKNLELVPKLKNVGTPTELNNNRIDSIRRPINKTKGRNL
ncbi:hypothetical protein [Leptospira weilii]|uniref:hypothetical protein n=1 Tax=Leptospira weilii TaxID=28184 RepID=UPI000AF88F8A|nr:hypothetical protein [Leptospira weilii]